MKHITTFFIISLLVDIVIPTFAQSYQSNLTHSSAYASIEGKALYILGGISSSTDKPTSQLLLIDLSTSWNTSYPSIKSLPGAPSNGFTPASLSKDNQSLVVLSNNKDDLFDLATFNWTTASATTDNSTLFKVSNSSSSLGAVTDPETGYIYVPNGAINLDNSNNNSNSSSTAIAQNETAFLLGFDPSTNRYFVKDTPSEIQMLSHFSVAWTASLKKLLLFGGLVANNLPVNQLYSYSSQEGWKYVITTGDLPSPRAGACLVSANRGSEIILFGGLSKPDNTSSVLSPQSDIYVLNVNTLVWTKGPSANSSEARSHHSCAISHDQLIVWGGTNKISSKSKSVTSLSSTIVYNLNKSIWTNQYSAQPTTLSADGLGESDTSGSGSSSGSTVLSADSPIDPTTILKIVIGCCVGSILLGILYYMIIYRYCLDPLDSDKSLKERFRLQAVRRAIKRAEDRAADSIAMTSQELRENYGIPKDINRKRSKLNTVMTIDDSERDDDQVSVSNSHYSQGHRRSPHGRNNYSRLHNYDKLSSHSSSSLNDFDSTMADICTKSTIEPRNPAVIRTRDMMAINDFNENIERMTSELNEIIHIEANKPLYINSPLPRTITPRYNNTQQQHR